MTTKSTLEQWLMAERVAYALGLQWAGFVTWLFTDDNTFAQRSLLTQDGVAPLDGDALHAYMYWSTRVMDVVNLPTGAFPALRGVSKTGRIRWIVADDATLHAGVYRPRVVGPVLSCTCTPDVVEFRAAQGAFGVRHVKSLHHLLLHTSPEGFTVGLIQPLYHDATLNDAAEGHHD